MKRIQTPLLIVFLSLFMTACGSDGLYRFTLITEGEHVFAHNLAGDLIIIGGSVTLPAGITLDGSAHVFSGSLNVDGQITGDVSFLNGDLTLGPTARIGGDLNLGGGSYHPSPAAVIEGRVNTGAGIPLPDLPERSAPNGWISLLRTLVSGSLMGLAAAVLARCAPGAVGRVSEATVRHSLVSGAVGLLVGVVGISLLVMMAYTILLIPVALLGLFVLGVAVLYGWIGLGFSAGRLGTRVLKRPLKPSTQAFFGTLVFFMGLELLTSIPMIGGLVGISLAGIGLGAVSLTRFGLRRFVPAADENLSE
ncbi:MAG: polymer-forming cytoskeletal protein [Chloroflexota bacterium]|nr:polymer-forming cytoskeletal protein [Chloroflexota bacterium]